ncbi:MAG TPA: DUF1428 domain-containing protein [Rhizobiaceae bacterium]|nr:DUF1428 domain-containing protein [Rhizobiaceae bacterium]
MSYIDGFVVPVPTGNRDKYIELAREMAEIFKECGAMSVTECWGDDVPDGEVTSFPMAVKLEPGETVVFSFTVWPSRQVRDEGMKKAMADPRMQMDPSKFPFDGKRMIWGGFSPIVTA